MSLALAGGTRPVTGTNPRLGALELELHAPAEHVHELLSRVSPELGEVRARLELDDHRHHHALHARREKPELDPFGRRRERPLLRLPHEVGLGRGLDGDEVAQVDPVERDEADEPADRDVALAVLDERQKRRGDARRGRDVAQREGLRRPGRAER